MPEDTLFSDKAADPAPEGTPPGNGADPTADAPLTMAAAAEMMTQVITPMAERLEELGQANARLAQHIQTPAPGAGAEPTKDQEDFLTRFSQDPEGAIISLQNQGLREAAPLVGALLNSTVQTAVEKEKTSIDGEFGTGAWDKFFDKPLTVVLDSYRRSNVAALGDSAVITRETDGLKGRQFDALVSYRDESRKKATDSTESGKKEVADGILAQIQQTNLTGGLRRVASGSEEITEDLKGYLNERTAAIGGPAEAPKDWLERTDYGNTYEEFQAHQKKLEAQKEKK